MSKKRVPCVVNMNSVAPVSPDQALTKTIRLRRLITNAAHGSNLMLGVAFLDPGEETNVWSFKDKDEKDATNQSYGLTEETYFVFRGNLVLSWDEGKLDIGPGDAVYLAPGYNYQLKNVGIEPAFLTYSMTPPCE